MARRRNAQKEQDSREFICGETQPHLANVIKVLVYAALNGDVRAALAILSYHSPPPKDPKVYVNDTQLAELPVERRADMILQRTLAGSLDLDMAERLMRLADTRMKQENTQRFLTFLRRVAEGADPVAVARELAAELVAESEEALH